MIVGYRQQIEKDERAMQHLEFIKRDAFLKVGEEIGKHVEFKKIKDTPTSAEYGIDLVVFERDKWNLFKEKLRYYLDNTYNINSNDINMIGGLIKQLEGKP